MQRGNIDILYTHKYLHFLGGKNKKWWGLTSFMDTHYQK